MRRHGCWAPSGSVQRDRFALGRGAAAVMICCLVAAGWGCVPGDSGEPTALLADAVEIGTDDGTAVLAEGCPEGVMPRPIFGPERFERTTGRPVTESRSFVVTEPDAIYTLVVFNGNPAGRTAGERERVSAAVIAVNGRTVAGSDRFSMTVPFVCVPIGNVAEGSNDLTVELRSRPGSFLTVVIVRTFAPVELGDLDFSGVAPARCVAQPRGSTMRADGVVIVE